jgi:hypothetical protein
MLRSALLPILLVACCFGICPDSAFPQGGTGNNNGNGNNNAGGILIDPEGVLKPLQVRPGLTPRRRPGKPETKPGEVCVSLRRLNDCLAQATPETLPRDAHVLGGLTRIDQIVVDAEARDVFLIGPGEPQAAGNAPTFVGEASARPLMRTGDFLTMLAGARGGRFQVRCSIDPEPTRLKQYNDRIRATSASVNFANAAAWYEGLARIMGRQLVTLGGVPEDSRVGNVLAAADYSMKRIALGIEPSGVKEIRGQLAYAAGDVGSTMKRWWFAPLYEDLAVNPERTVFQLSGPRVRLVAQQELILDDGSRVNDSNRPSTEAFARQFTEHFEELTVARPIFADLKNQFDLAVVASLLVREKLLDRFEISLQPAAAVVEQLSPKCAAPRFVESGANIRRVNKGTIVGAVGGVEIAPRDVLTRERPLVQGLLRVRQPPAAELSGTQFSWSVGVP